MSAPIKRGLGVNVCEAARERIAWAFDTFPRLYVSFSGGKDSSAMTHLVMEEARRRGRRVGALFVDLEAQYALTVAHVSEVFALYGDAIEPFWVCLPLNLRNAVSMFAPQWTCWDPEAGPDWVRQPPPGAVTDAGRFPFYRHAMEFEEFVPAFGHWYGGGQPTACFVGIRSDESLNRFRTVAGHGTKFEGRPWTNHIGGHLWNVYPVYDWRVEDVWTYHGRFGRPHNRLYDRMHQAGLTLAQMRICQPYGDDQRRGLWLFHVIEPETWARVVARVAGANAGALYVQESGNIMGQQKITKPGGHTWQSFALLLIESLPPPRAGAVPQQGLRVPTMVAGARLPGRDTGRGRPEGGGVQESPVVAARLQGAAPQRLLVQDPLLRAAQERGLREILQGHEEPEAPVEPTLEPVLDFSRGAAAILESARALCREIGEMPEAERVAVINEVKRALHAVSPLCGEPVDCVLWVPADRVEANDYNPNSVAPPEMRLLEHSIREDGYTQPVVAFEEEDGAYTVVDGFHRKRVGKECPEVRARVRGYLPVAIVNQGRGDRGDRIAATIRHNRARGKHEVTAMSEIVLELARRNWDDRKIGRELGMDPDEVLRLKQISGLAEMFADREFSEAWEVSWEQ